MAWVKRGAITTFSILLLAVLFIGMKWGQVDAGAPPREVVLVVRDMTFYADGRFDAANPALKLRAGERVRLVLRNEDPGMRHNFSVPAWDVATRELNGEGATSVDFVVPRTRGTHEYVCSPHALMMRGVIEIH
jgi:plastocyanin